MTSPRQLHLNVHLVGAGLGVHPAAWRWPAADPAAFADVDRWVEAALVAERGLLDAVFLSDVPGVWGDITHDPQGAYYLEPTLVLDRDRPRHRADRADRHGVHHLQRALPTSPGGFRPLT